MSHVACGKAFQGKGFTHHVVHDGSNSAVAGASDENRAREDALRRTEKAKEFGLTCQYVVKPVSECKYSQE